MFREAHTPGYGPACSRASFPARSTAGRRWFKRYFMVVPGVLPGGTRPEQSESVPSWGATPDHWHGPVFLPCSTPIRALVVFVACSWRVYQVRRLQAAACVQQSQSIAFCTSGSPRTHASPVEPCRPLTCRAVGAWWFVEYLKAHPAPVYSGVESLVWMPMWPIFPGVEASSDLFRRVKPLHDGGDVRQCWGLFRRSWVCRVDSVAAWA